MTAGNLFDAEGFLIDLECWNEPLAERMAEQEKIKLSSAHWALIHQARDYYNTFDLSPEMRPFIKWLSVKLGQDKANSLYLLTLFPGSPAKLISKIAGLPKPTNCL